MLHDQIFTFPLDRINLISFNSDPTAEKCKFLFYATHHQLSFHFIIIPLTCLVYTCVCVCLCVCVCVYVNLFSNCHTFSSV